MGMGEVPPFLPSLCFLLQSKFLGMQLAKLRSNARFSIVMILLFTLGVYRMKMEKCPCAQEYVCDLIRKRGPKRRTLKS